MSIKGVRPTVYVCSSITDSGELVNKILSASSKDEASTLFAEQTSLKAKEILGPFLKKRVKVLDKTRVLKFSTQTKKAIYDDWLVNAFLLKEPENQAYLVFIKRTDGKKATIPNGTVIVPISDLRFV